MSLSENSMLVGRYRIERALSQGGMGTIYAAFDTNLQTRVAIKENAFQTEHSATQFKKEALLLAKLRHPSLPRVVQQFIERDKQYLVMDFIEGQDLWEIIKTHGHPLASGQAVQYISQICDAVGYLHNQSPPVIHRDIKPQNIKITPAGQAVLVDFGIAKEDIAGEKTMTGARGVTPGFSPPEQYSGTGTNPSSDIYALGATLFALLTGKRPPDSISLMVNKQKFIPTTMTPNLNPDVSQVISWAMELHTTQRPPSVQIWRQKLQQVNVADGVPTEMPTALPTLPKSTPVLQQLWLIDEQGYKYQLSPEKTLTAGRLSACDISIKSPSVSRKHAAFSLVGQRYMVYDNNSSNGTFVNKQKVGPNGAPLKPGDTLTIGYSELRVEGAARPAPFRPVSHPVSPPPPPPPITPQEPLWEEIEEIGGLAGMTQMLTLNIAKKMEGMSTLQTTILGTSLVVGMVVATLLLGNVIRTYIPWLWFLFPFYYIAGPTAYVLSRRKGSALLVHVPTQVLVLSVVTAFATIPYLQYAIAGIIAGAIMEGVFAVLKIPGWIRYPVGVGIAYVAGSVTLLLTVDRFIFNPAETIGAILIGVLVYAMGEIQKGVQKARSSLQR